MASVLLAAAALVGGIALASGNDTNQHGRCINGAAAEGFIRPGVAVEIGDSWWPVGTRCRYLYPDGSSAEMVVRFPTTTLAAIVLVALVGASIPALAVVARRRRHRART